MRGGKLKILWSSVSPQVETGYGRVSKEIVTRLKKAGFDIIYHGYQHQFNQDWDGIQILKTGEKEQFGEDVLTKYFNKYERDVVITLFDLWKLNFMPKLGIRWIPYFPIDAAPLTEPLIEPAKSAYKRICFSDFAKELLDNAGIENSMIPHGIDTKVFKPLTNRDELRKNSGIDKDDFIIGTVGMNIFDRKDFPRMIRIFSEFVHKNKLENAYLYLHTNPDIEPPFGFNIKVLAKQYRVEKFVRCFQKNPFVEPLQNTGLAKMYNTFDVTMITSRAEGCCLPVLESQACGVPCIVSDYSATPEWVRGHGWTVKADDYIHALTTTMMNHWHLMDINEGVKALEDAYFNRGKIKKYGKIAREEMLKYDWDKIVEEKWVPYLNALEKEIYSETRKIKVNGKEMIVRNDTIDELVVNSVIGQGEYRKMIELTKKDRWLDIGGHIGSFTVDISNEVENVYIFEPVKDNWKLLLKNTESFTNVGTYNYAIIGTDDKTRKLNLFLQGEQNTGGHSLIGEGDGEEIKCKNINNVLDEFGINKIKLDCEGSEYEILKAITEDNLKKMKEIILEYHFNLLGLSKFEELVKYLEPNFKVNISRYIDIAGQTIIHCKRL
jgi:FkbM family methyltransferase